LEKLLNVLEKFEPITLDEMNNVKLMDRMDTKFIFRIESLPYLLGNLQEHYKVLVVKEKYMSRYESLYFDTTGFNLYHMHHSGKLNRYKVRLRKYVESELHFFEVKFKNNKGRTIKDRVKRNNVSEKIKGKAKALLLEKTPYSAEELEPKLWINYSRITLVSQLNCERVTIDLKLNFKNDDKDVKMHPLVIAEVKQEKSKSSPFLSLMKKNYIRKGSISKYCIGVANLYGSLKKNNFKPKLLNLNKLCYGINKTVH
jgi:hypothetical protein